MPGSLSMPTNLTKAICVPIYIQTHAREDPRGVIKYCFMSNGHKIYMVLILDTAYISGAYHQIDSHGSK